MIDLLTKLDSYEAYAVPLAAAWALYAAVKYTGESRSRKVRDAADDAGLSEPPSLHPVIDPALCFGCGACAHACPEGGSVLGLINGRAELIDPVSCIGHGACKTACPVAAIDLVFGTATRGVDIPQVSPQFESNVPGLFVAGELGGMGLIANAIEQGRQAVESIARLDGLKKRGQWDLVIVGAGPAGFAASLAAKQRGLTALTLEQASFGGTVAHYPREKIVMTRPATLPLYGKVRLRRVPKERLLDLWRKVLRKTGIEIRYGERVEDIAPRAGGFEVTTATARYPARAVLLATGRRGSPRTLGVPGEDLGKVVYSLVDARQYRGQRVIVVGGGDAALEAASALARERGVDVTLCHRGQAFGRARPLNRAAAEAAGRDGRMRILLDTTVIAIHAGSVEIEVRGRRHVVGNDAVVVCAGGTMPGSFLRRIGIAVETKYGTA